MVMWLRQHERVLNLPWKPTVKRSEKTSAIDVMVSGMLSDDVSIEKWKAHFTESVQPFTQEERRAWLSKLTDVVVCSDACFRFRDNIDCVRQFGARYIACPSGTSQEIVDVCNEHGLVLIHVGHRFVQSS
ncbi:hypothetical protein QR680_002487 [Steinernema hermaphroditum]|uniref:Uncharacterized protein n=1 Tax=Steinernema hermaphroditum TaxID=289476 RepID=A0AA39H2X6_9BILA|nr:hypothetical protein QR680_002487 [Steinernema hermaphroditum]